MTSIQPLRPRAPPPLPVVPPPVSPPVPLDPPRFVVPPVAAPTTSGRATACRGGDGATTRPAAAHATSAGPDDRTAARACRVATRASGCRTAGCRNPATAPRATRRHGSPAATRPARRNYSAGGGPRRATATAGAATRAAAGFCGSAGPACAVAAFRRVATGAKASGQESDHEDLRGYIVGLWHHWWFAPRKKGGSRRQRIVSSIIYTQSYVIPGNYSSDPEVRWELTICQRRARSSHTRSARARWVERSTPMRLRNRKTIV